MLDDDGRRLTRGTRDGTVGERCKGVPQGAGDVRARMEARVSRRLILLNVRN